MDGTPQSTVEQPLPAEEVDALDAYWRAANYVSVGQIYLLDNPLLRRPLAPDDVKPRLLGHWGTTPGLNLVYVHASRVIKERDLDAIWIVGPGHGGPAAIANEVERGLKTLASGEASAGSARFKGGAGRHGRPAGEIEDNSSPQS